MRNRTAIIRFIWQTRLGVGLALWTVALAPSPASAQVMTMPNVKSGQTVWATRPDGTTIKGQVIALDGTRLDLKDGERRTSLPLADIQRIEARDSLRNGAIIGAIPTAILFGLGAGALSTFCVSAICNGDPSSAALKGLLVGAGMGALIGAGIDRAIPGRRVLYRSPGAAAAVTIAPVVSRRGAGVGMSLRW